MSSNTSNLIPTLHASLAKPLPPLPVTSRSAIWQQLPTTAINVELARPTRDWDITGKYNPARPWMLKSNPNETPIQIASFIQVTRHNVENFAPTFLAQVTDLIYMIRKDYIDAYATVDPNICPSAIIIRIPIKWFLPPSSFKTIQELPENEKENERYMNNI